MCVYCVRMHVLQKELLGLARQGKLSGKSLRDITKLVGEKYPQKIKHHLLKLQQKGFLIYDIQNRRVTMRENAPAKDTNLISIPILGTANAGPALSYTDGNIEGYLKISKKLLSSHSDKLSAIRATGNSMNRAQIGRDKLNVEEGDYVLIDSSNPKPNDGEYVVSTIGGLANIKKYIVDEQNKAIALVSQSTQNYPPILLHNDDLDDYVYNGTVVQVIKNPTYLEETSA